MKYLERDLSIEKDLKRKSVLILGPRRTGKTQLIKHQIRPDVTYDLLRADTFRELSFAPETIRQQLNSKTRVIAIDEIQKLPILMDEVHSMIESFNVRFVLTGSSARKLKRTHTSLMAGRARLRNLLPLTSFELKKEFRLMTALQRGLLPAIYFSDSYRDDLNDYIGLYLREEILNEALVRRIDNFSRFIQFAATTNGQILNFESLGSDAQISARTVREYYSVLTDTLLGYFVEPLDSTKSRKSTSTSKFYYFDIGIVNGVLGRQLSPKTKEFGETLEHFVFLELHAYKTYRNPEMTIHFWNSPRQGEIDFILNEEIGIEVKATGRVGQNHLKGFELFERGGGLRKKIVVCGESVSRKIGNVDVLPISQFLEMLWAGEIV